MMMMIFLLIMLILVILAPILFVASIVKDNVIILIISIIIIVFNFTVMICSSDRMEYKKNIKIINYKSIGKDLQEDYYIVYNDGSISYPLHYHYTEYNTRLLETSYGQKYLDCIIPDRKEIILYVNSNEVSK